MESIEYKGYTIEKDYQYNPYSHTPYYKFYPTSEGAQDDADCDGDGFFYCGNAKWEPSLEYAKSMIDELTFEEAI